MPCNHLRLDNGAVAIICGGRKTKYCKCGKPSEFQCDWKIGGGRTCSRHLCGDHAQEVAPNKHLCPDHQGDYAVWKSDRKETVDAG